MRLRYFEVSIKTPKFCLLPWSNTRKSKQIEHETHGSGKQIYDLKADRPFHLDVSPPFSSLKELDDLEDGKHVVLHDYSTTNTFSTNVRLTDRTSPLVLKNLDRTVLDNTPKSDVSSSAQYEDPAGCKLQCFERDDDFKVDDCLIPSTISSNEVVEEARTQLDTAHPQSCPTIVKWYWEGETNYVKQYDAVHVLDNTAFIAFRNEISRQIEDGYQSFFNIRTENNSYKSLAVDIEDNATLKTILPKSVNIGKGGQYSIDFDNMIMINSKTNHLRNILRKVCFRHILSKKSQNYLEAEEYFLMSLGSKAAQVRITGIEMILNPTLWQMYCAYLKGIQIKTPDRSPSKDGRQQQHPPNSPQAFERRWLFHGTKADRVPKIIRNGFNRSFNTKYSIGRGTYFARDAPMACRKDYAIPDTTNGDNRCVFLCRVAVGHFCKANDPKMTVPPCTTRKHDDGETYDTTVDNMDDPSIFVAYHDAQAYPEYLIHFKYMG